jgi:hypothetical protein
MPKEVSFGFFKGIIHDSPEEFIEALKSSGAERVYIVDAIDWAATFIDPHLIVHCYRVEDYSPADYTNFHRIHEAVKAQGIAEVDGIISPSESENKIYHLFGDFHRSDPEKSRRAFQVWVDLVAPFYDQVEVMVYVKDEKDISLEVTAGLMHYIVRRIFDPCETHYKFFKELIEKFPNIVFMGVDKTNALYQNVLTDQ